MEASLVYRAYSRAEKPCLTKKERKKRGRMEEGRKKIKRDGGRKEGRNKRTNEHTNSGTCDILFVI